MQSVDLLRNYASLLLDTQGYVRNLTKFLILSVVLFLQLRGRRPKSLRELEIKLRETKLNSSLFFTASKLWSIGFFCSRHLCSSGAKAAEASIKM